MKNTKADRQEQIERLALDLLDACGGELNSKDIKRFWENEERCTISKQDRNYVEQYAEQLISMP